MPNLSELPSSCRQVGIFGGTFNPVHYGHLEVAKQALCQFNLDAVIWIPAGLPPHKPLATGASNRDRLEMVKLAIADCPQFYWSDIELLRQGKSFAFDTIERLQIRYPDIQQWYWIIGADAIADLPSWHRAEEIASRCHWIVAPRPNTPRNGLMATVGSKLPHIHASWLASSEQPISSSNIRQLLQEGKNATKFMPEAVASYLQSHQLYRSPGQYEDEMNFFESE